MSTPTAGSNNRGTRSRAGNAMGRTREAALSGAVQAIAKYGSRKATMADIAMLAGIAKATLYNHFRTRDDLYAAVVLAEVDAIATAASQTEGFESALCEALRVIGEHSAVRRVVRDEPAVGAALAAVGDGPGWAAARAHITAALCSAGLADSPAGVDLVLRQLSSQLLSPIGEAQRIEAARLLTAALAANQPAALAASQPAALAASQPAALAAHQPAAPDPVGSSDTST